MNDCPECRQVLPWGAAQIHHFIGGFAEEDLRGPQIFKKCGVAKPGVFLEYPVCVESREIKMNF
jgi:hypothetical protein